MLSYFLFAVCVCLINAFFNKQILEYRSVSRMCKGYGITDRTELRMIPFPVRHSAY